MVEVTRFGRVWWQQPGNVVAFVTTSPELVTDPNGPGVLCFAARSAKPED